ncbi:MAG: tetratricopeptide repeat protein [Deltaproteobacteria bacterium]|nr:tetratricopeptide repeat protein [Deltaproteobacteria bacterium]
MRRAALCLCLALWAPGALAQAPRLPFPLRGPAARPTPAEVEFSAGDSLMQRGDLAGALPRFEAARRLDPRDARPVFYLGEVAFRQGRHADAEALFREALRLQPTLAEARAELGATLRELHRCAEAIPELEAALRTTPSLGEAHTTLGQCAEDGHDTPRALTAYRAAQRSLPDDPLPGLYLGLLLASGDPPAGSPLRNEALQALRGAVRRGDRDASVLALAGPALRRLGDPRGAVLALERARSLQRPPTAAVLGELAQALAASGQLPAARARVDEALGLAPQEANLHYLSGLIRAAAGDVPGAMDAFRAVLRLSPQDPLAARARARLTSLGTQGARRP